MRHRAVYGTHVIYPQRLSNVTLNRGVSSSTTINPAGASHPLCRNLPVNSSVIMCAVTSCPTNVTSHLALSRFQPKLGAAFLLRARIRALGRPLSAPLPHIIRAIVPRKRAHACSRLRRKADIELAGEIIRETACNKRQCRLSGCSLIFSFQAPSGTWLRWLVAIMASLPIIAKRAEMGSQAAVLGFSRSHARRVGFWIFARSSPKSPE
jgi:hypothetical protein